METRRVRVHDVELAYNELAGPGPPLVLQHGLTGHRDDFAHRMPDLAGQARILAPDLRGHGDCSRPIDPASYTIARLVSDLAAFLDALEVERCDLLGHSFGGMVALRFALAQPERVASLVLLCTAPFCPPSYSAETFRRAGAIACERGMSALQSIVEKRWRNAPDENVHTARWADVYWAHHRRRYAAMDPVAYTKLGIAMTEQEPVVERLPEIACPTTILVGEDDEEFLDGANALEAGIPHALRRTLANAGHHPHMENPEAWLTAIREHLERARA